MDLDETTLSTLSHLESRLLRIEHLLYGHTTPPPKTSAVSSLQALKHRFGALLQSPRGRVYAELLRIYKAHPYLFHAPANSTTDSNLSHETQRSIILAAASSYPAIASSLTSISDTPIPDPALSANLASLMPRMKGVEATQMAQAAEIAELQVRSELLVRQWYEGGVMAYSNFIAEVEGRVERVEQDVRRAKRVRDEV